MARTEDRPTRWWLETLRRRAERTDAHIAMTEPIRFESEAERAAAVRFFNAAFRAEESGLRQAHELAAEVRELDPELAEVLRLYGDEEGWHRELLTEFLAFLGGEIKPMGKVTRTLYLLYGSAKRMETILLTNLMFETIGSTTYRLALGRVRHLPARQMLTILTRDEAFHVPLNVHFLRRVLGRSSRGARWRLRFVQRALFLSLTLLPLASRPKARAFDGIGTLELSRAYARELARVFASAPELGLPPPWLLLRLLGVDRCNVERSAFEPLEDAAERERVACEPLTG
ncbi:MAG: ferritin-like domain-containing protein [Polyangiaceae bacterium]|nr:ferritin-like domain-containing protein [Polyangiaceae bacterium]